MFVSVKAIKKNWSIRTIKFRKLSPKVVWSVSLSGIHPCTRSQQLTVNCSNILVKLFQIFLIIDQDKHHGYGVLRSVQEGWRFLSLWKEGQKHGRGIFLQSSGLFAQTLFSFDQLLDSDGLLFDQKANAIDGDEKRMFIGSVSTVVDSNAVNQLPQINLGKGKLMLMNDDRNGDLKA